MNRYDSYSSNYNSQWEEYSHTFYGGNQYVEPNYYSQSEYNEFTQQYSDPSIGDLINALNASTLQLQQMSEQAYVPFPQQPPTRMSQDQEPSISDMLKTLLTKFKNEEENKVILKINILLHTTIKQVPPYAKLPKELYTNKRKLKGLLKETSAIIRLANCTNAYPLRVLEDVLVHVQFGRPFLLITSTKMDVKSWVLIIEFDGEVIQFDKFNSIDKYKRNKSIYQWIVKPQTVIKKMGILMTFRLRCIGVELTVHSLRFKVVEHLCNLIFGNGYCSVDGSVLDRISIIMSYLHLGSFGKVLKKKKKDRDVKGLPRFHSEPTFACLQTIDPLKYCPSFAFSFSIISVLSGVTTLYNNGLRFGGSVSLIYGWLIACSFSMAEICSSYLTSGGLYYWSTKLAGPKWSPFASWITGWYTITYRFVNLIRTNFKELGSGLSYIGSKRLILTQTGGKTGGGYEASKYSVIAFHGGILLLHAITNSLPISWLSFFGQLAAAWNIVGVFILIILIPSIATERASVKYVFTHFNTDNEQGIGDSVYIFILGLLMSQYSLTGYDASAHMVEETKIADKNGPRGIISVVGISIIVGLCYILGITFAVTNITSLLDENNDSGGYAIVEIFYQAFKSRYGSGAGVLFAWEWLLLQFFFCGMSPITSNSRMAYAFSRDGAMPFSSLWNKVNKQEVPINAVWFSASISFCMALTVIISIFFLFSFTDTKVL
ncbi:amino-acid permease BAT1-like [Humulus lupulus]|uniref:amino-acid permease BAT1-like n=1 Tax=Humulus lupulus TaxID=3486 RepID=UPI002B40FF22|nr:amino-acid permease BAT1-like [Humulus lupulus]